MNVVPLPEQDLVLFSLVRREGRYIVKGRFTDGTKMDSLPLTFEDAIDSAVRILVGALVEYHKDLKRDLAPR